MTIDALAATPRLAVIAHEDLQSCAADALLASFARSLAGEGWPIGGVVHARRLDAAGRKRMFLIDVASGREFCISQDLGPQSRACCVDPGAVAQASGVLRQALADRVWLAIVNRFGELEATGGGFAAELAALAGEGVPVLTAVSRKHLQAWRHFAGDAGIELPLDVQALHDWAQRACAPAAEGASAAPGKAA